MLKTDTMIEIDLILIGNVKDLIDTSYLKRWGSNIFSIRQIKEIILTPDNGFDDPNCTFDKLKELKTDSRLTIAISNYYFPKNLISLPLTEHLISLSIYDFDKMLADEKIRIEKYILRFIYSFSIIYQTNDKRLPETTDLIHRDIQGCIFDYCKRHIDTLKFHNDPKLSSHSRLKLESKNKPVNYLKVIDKEIKRLNRSYIEKLELYVKKNPAMTTIISLIIGFILGLITNMMK
jgi:hypothetical protein